MSARKDGHKPRRGEKRLNGIRHKIVPKCKMAWPAMIQFLLDYPGGISRSIGERDFAGRIFYYYFTIRLGELQYYPGFEGEIPRFTKRGTAQAHDFMGLKWFEAYTPKCECPKCIGSGCCCCHCKCQETQSCS